MCGRFTNSTPRPEVIKHFGVLNFEEGDWRPRYNVSPAQRVDAVVLEDGQRRLTSMRWGFTPTAALKGRPLPINARSETVASQPLFRDSFAARRCLVVADGFYEWKPETTNKVPYFIRLGSHQPFGFAGIWRTLRIPDREPIPICSILTCEPNSLMATIHRRMPVIVPPSRYADWLTPETPIGAVHELLRPYDAGAMEAYAVSRVVNSPRTDSPACIEPAAAPTGT